jgi:hypothetical protein
MNLNLPFKGDMNPSRRTFLIQILVVVILIGIVILLAVIIIPQTVPPNQHRITLRVESSSGTATIQYDAGSNKQKDPDKTFSTPWERTYNLESGTQVLLTAGNHEQMGTIKCILLMDGATWKSQAVSMPDDKVACAGIVR